MKKNILYSLLVTAALSQSTLAATMPKGSADNSCGYFHVQISNLTKSTCVLSIIDVKHGNLDSSPAGTIMPGDSKVFQMEQTMIGPEVTLSYQCGAENITFTSKQDLCFMEAGNISGRIEHPVPVNINASYSAVMGSYFWGKPGHIYWKIMSAA